MNSQTARADLARAQDKYAAAVADRDGAMRTLAAAVCASRAAGDAVTAARAGLASLADQAAAGREPDADAVRNALCRLAEAEGQVTWSRAVLGGAERRVAAAQVALRAADRAATEAADVAERAIIGDRVRELAAAARARTAA